VAPERSAPTPLRTPNAVFFFFLFSSRFRSFKAWVSDNLYSYVIYPSIPAGVWVILPPLQLRARHIGQAPGPAGASPHLPKLPGAEEASGRVVL